MTLANAIQSGIFFCSDGSNFSYVAFCLADGLNQLGIPIFSNISGSHYSTPFCFKAELDPVLLKNSYCAVMGIEGMCDQYPLTVKPLTSIHNRTVAICMHDNIANFGLKNDIPLFCTHENALRQFSGIRLPIGFGLSQQMLDAAQNVQPFEARQKYVLDCFHPSLNQDIRACLELALVPNLSKYLPVQKRNTECHSDHMALLNDTAFCLAYGGQFFLDLSKSPCFMSLDIFKDFFNYVTYKENSVIMRWDSWRFWESLVSGCVTIHLDFDHYGFLLPVMPTNWKHYIGINLANIKQDVERIMDEWDRMPEIAWNGRLWALEHYSPISVARRFLQTVQGLEGQA